VDRKVVLATQKLHPVGMALLEERVELRIASSLDPATLACEVPGAHALVVRMGRITEEVIAAGTSLQVIGQNAVGLDNIDVAAATRRGIPVVHTPGANSVSVAEYVIGAVLTLARRFPLMDREMRAGNWLVRNQWGRELSGCTFGVIGLGHIGSLVARRCRAAFDAEILALDPYLPPAQAAALEITLADSLDELLRRSDVVSLHVPLTAETEGLLGARELALMKPTAYLINAARGPVVDEAALAAALRRGTIAGAAVDVYSQEPPPPEHPLWTAPNLLLTPHIGALTDEAMGRMARTMVTDVLAVLEGRRPRYIANPEVLRSSL